MEHILIKCYGEKNNLICIVKIHNCAYILCGGGDCVGWGGKDHPKQLSLFAGAENVLETGEL